MIYIPGGTTQHDVALQAVKRIRKDVEVDARIQFEEWKAPLLKAASQNDVSTAVQVTWHPKFEH
jgi:hypothetical protein